MTGTDQTEKIANLYNQMKNFQNEINELIETSLDEEQPAEAIKCLSAIDNSLFSIKRNLLKTLDIIKKSQETV